MKMKTLQTGGGDLLSLFAAEPYAGEMKLLTQLNRFHLAPVAKA